ncbi:MAG: UTP--glucose-1-phosphate uridylyltransferase, partial [Nitrospinota bacterium]
PFAVLLGDDIIHSKQPVIGQLIDVFNETGTSVIAVEEVPWESVSSYGVISVKEKESERLYELGEMVEKPPRSEAPSNLAIIGRYILTPEIFPMLEKTRQDKSGEIQLTNAMKMLLGTQKISGCQFAGKRYDAGNKLGFLKATVEFALRRDDLGGEFRSYLKELDI